MIQITHMDWVVIAMLGIPILYIAIDVLLATNKRRGDTYSEIISKAAKKFMPLALLISFGFGLLTGHWFW